MTNQTRVRVVLSAALAVALSVAVHALGGQAADIVGSWTGTIDDSLGQSYNGVMTFTSPERGSSDYPSLECGGRLSGSESDGVYRFTETITRGRATETSGGCIDGRIEMTIDGDTMMWRWLGSWQGQSITASATFRRN